MLADNIYLYHLDSEVQKLYIRGNYHEAELTKIRQHFSNIVRLAYLLCRKKLFVPLSNYLESALAFDILNQFSNITPPELNPITYLSTAVNLESALKKKESAHRDNFHVNPQFRYEEFTEKGLVLPGAFQTRDRSASEDIEAHLTASIANEELWGPFQKFMTPSLNFEGMQNQLAAIPQHLAGQAYISDYILPFLSIEPQMIDFADRQMNINITRWYLKSFLTEFDAVCLKDIHFVNANEILPTIEGREHLSYSFYVNELCKVRVKRKHRLPFKEQDAFNYINSCKIGELVTFKHSPEWKAICSPPPNQTRKIFSLGVTNLQYADVKIGIVTALPKEYTAIKMLLDNANEVLLENEDAKAGNRYLVGEVRRNNGSDHHKVALCLLPRYGNNYASIFSTKMMAYFQNIKDLIICGIAGGIPSEVRLGDLVVSTNGVIQYDLGADKPDSFIPKNNPKDCSDYLLEAVKYLSAEEDERGCPWLNYIDDIDKNTDADYSRPKVSFEQYEAKVDGNYTVVKRDVATKTSSYFGKIGSGNTVQKNAMKRDWLNEQHGVIAIEMEAAGVSDATHLEKNGYIAVRGICDYCDLQKNDEWQYYAAAVAAAYTYALIKSIPTQTRDIQ